MTTNHNLILITGATGYIGGQLLRALQNMGRPVRCLVRNPAALPAFLAPSTDVRTVNFSLPEDVTDHLRGIDTAYYFIHSMTSVGDFASEDRRCARNFGQAAKEAGVKRIIYLGGLGDDEEDLSLHLKSRHEVGDVLRESGVPVVEFRTSVVIGAGSLSFELIRRLVQRLPVMVTPRWVNNPTQPIGIETLIQYFLAALDLPVDGNKIFEIGGADVVSYGDLMREYARQRGLRRIILPVPVVTPRLSGLWLKLVTPSYARVGCKLIASLRNPTVVKNHAARDAFAVRPKGVKDMIARALEAEDETFAASRWAEGIPLRSWCGAILGSRIIDHRRAEVDTSPEKAFRAIQRIGGEQGWYFANVLWKFRGILDRLAGGPGMRGRKDPVELKAGDVVDFWKVEYIEPGQELLLQSDLRLPGRAWLQFEVKPTKNGCLIAQTALYDPMGLLGFLAWYALYPFHKLIFAGMIRALARRAKQEK